MESPTDMVTSKHFSCLNLIIPVANIFQKAKVILKKKRWRDLKQSEKD